MKTTWKMTTILYAVSQRLSRAESKIIQHLCLPHLHTDSKPPFLAIWESPGYFIIQGCCWFRWKTNVQGNEAPQIITGSVLFPQVGIISMRSHWLVPPLRVGSISTGLQWLVPSIQTDSISTMSQWMTAPLEARNISTRSQWPACLLEAGRKHEGTLVRAVSHESRLHQTVGTRQAESGAHSFSVRKAMQEHMSKVSLFQRWVADDKTT